MEWTPGPKSKRFGRINTPMVIGGRLSIFNHQNFIVKQLQDGDWVRLTSSPP